MSLGRLRGFWLVVASVMLVLSVSSCDRQPRHTWNTHANVDYHSPTPVNGKLVTCALQTDREVCKPGEIPTLSVSVTNVSDHKITLVKELFMVGLLVGQYPRGWFEIKRPDSRAIQGLWTQSQCATGAGLYDPNVVELGPGEGINPIWEKVHVPESASLEERLVRDSMKEPGTYTLRYVYDTADGDLANWFPVNPKELAEQQRQGFQKSMDRVTKVLVYGNPVTITIEGAATVSSRN